MPEYPMLDGYLYSMPQNAKDAIDDGKYMEAIDLIVATGARPPDPLLAAAARQANQKVPKGWETRVERYQGHVRIIVHKIGKEPAVED